MPNFVARKTSSRRPAIVLPTSRSFVCGPYMSEVSRKLQPRSSARVIVARASPTDFIDGRLARARDSVTAFGKLMDPLADKLLIVAALISLVSLHRLAAWVAMVIITRELAVTVLRLAAAGAGVVISATMFGKLKTCLQIATILAIIAVHGKPLWVSA